MHVALIQRQLTKSLGRLLVVFNHLVCESFIKMKSDETLVHPLIKVDGLSTKLESAQVHICNMINGNHLDYSIDFLFTLFLKSFDIALINAFFHLEFVFPFVSSPI